MLVKAGIRHGMDHCVVDHLDLVPINVYLVHHDMIPKFLYIYMQQMGSVTIYVY